MSFTSIPILDVGLAKNEATKPAFLVDLRRALLEVGFLYIKNFDIDQQLIQVVMAQGKAFFDIPLEKKLEIEMKNTPSFLGYSRLSAEITAGAVDHREQLDIATEHALPTKADPLYYNLRGPNQWPDPAVLPGFRETFQSYLGEMATMSTRFTRLIAEALGLPASAFDGYFDADQMHKLKIVKYPDLDALPEAGRTDQGVGPHKDSMLTSYLLQASTHRGLQARNAAGHWVDVEPLPGTLVVAIGQGLEALTKGACASTTHRVVSPAPGAGPRFSVPFFQGVGLDVPFAELEGRGRGVDVPAAVREQRRRVLEESGGGDDVEFTFRSGGKVTTLGEATLRNRVRSHPDVGERWYPEIVRDVRREQQVDGGKCCQDSEHP